MVHSPQQIKKWRTWFLMETIAEKGFRWFFRLSLLFLGSLIVLVFYIDSIRDESESVLLYGLPIALLVYALFIILTWSMVKRAAVKSAANREKLGLSLQKYKRLIDFQD
ncbi:MAG: hypothetical protein H0Z32_12655 [Bacillaceae bacterium]|nr:hypothetical protein [Bacillaceae bacterium]